MNSENVALHSVGRMWMGVLEEPMLASDRDIGTHLSSRRKTGILHYSMREKWHYVHCTAGIAKILGA